MGTLESRAVRALERDEDAAARFDQPEWPQPEPLISVTHPEEYPLGAMPDGIIRGAIEEVAAVTQAPVALPAASALSVVSLAVQAHIDVVRPGGLRGPTSLYFLSVAASGERKSTCDALFTKPIQEIERRQRELLQAEIIRYNAELAAFEAKESGMKDRLRKASDKGDPTEESERRLLELQKERPTPPRIPRYSFSDATPEALAMKLQGWPTAGIFSAEAGNVFGAHGMNSDTIMRNVAQMNSLWDGAPLSSDRKTSESIAVPSARLSVGLQVQPEVLDEFLRKNGYLVQGSGFLARCLFARPASTQGTRFFKDRPEILLGVDAFNRRVAELLEQPLPLDESGYLQPRALTFSEDAKLVWIEFYNTIEGQLADGHDLAEVRSTASKIAENAARLAACFTYFETPGVLVISGDVMRRAWTLAVWYLDEARRFSAETDRPGPLHDAARLNAWLIARCRTRRCLRVSRAEVMQYGPNALRRKAKLDRALDELVACHRIRIDPNGAIEVNPALVAGGVQ
jgi:putative DNA primase/helicase